MKDDATYLLHVLDALAQLEVYAREGREHFMTDRRTQEAVIRNLEVAGEAVKNLSVELREAHAEVPWKSIAGTRDKLVHEYFGVNLLLLWDLLETEVTPLRRSIEGILTERHGT